MLNDGGPIAFVCGAFATAAARHIGLLGWLVGAIPSILEGKYGWLARPEIRQRTLMMSKTVLFWRRTDVEGLERLELVIEPDGVSAMSTVICLEAGGFRLDHRWRLTPDWRAQSVVVECWNARGHGILRLERAGTGWQVDGAPRPDLEGAEEPDLSVTPFCNTFPIRRTPEIAGASLPLDTAFIDGPALTVTRSRQRYDRHGAKRLRYVDLGLSRGFEADLVVDDDGLVLSYEHLFERVAPSA
jgi:hypothetical protein